MTREKTSGRVPIDFMKPGHREQPDEACGAEPEWMASAWHRGRTRARTDVVLTSSRLERSGTPASQIGWWVKEATDHDGKKQRFSIAGRASGCIKDRWAIGAHPDPRCRIRAGVAWTH